MGKYSENLKESVIKRMLLPDGDSIMTISEDTGIPNQTLYNWLKKRRQNDTMEPGSGNKRKYSSMIEKQELILEAASVPPAKLGAWLREKGIHAEQLDLWRKEIRDSLKDGKNKELKEIAELKKQNQRLEKEIQKKDKTLSDITTLMAHKKKLEGIWFAPEEDS